MLLKKRLFLLLCCTVLLFPGGTAVAAKKKLTLDFSYTTDLRSGSLTIPFQWEVRGGTPPYQVFYTLHARSRQSSDDPVSQGSDILESMFRTEAAGQCSFVLDNHPEQFYWFDFYVKDSMGNSKRVKEVGNLSAITPPRLTATPGDGCVHLAWSNHEFDQGQYRLYQYEDNQYHMICEGDSFSYQDFHYTHLAENLENGKPCTFIVQSKTDEGWSNLHENFHVTVTPMAGGQNPKTEDMYEQRWERELAEVQAKAQMTLGDGPIKCHLWMDRTEISSGETLTLQWAFSGGVPPYRYDFILPSDIDIMRQSARGIGGQASFSLRPGR